MQIPDDENKIQNLKSFIDKWAGPTQPDYGLPPDDVPLYLPGPLREIYLSFGNRPHQRDNDDSQFMPGKQPRIFQEQDCLLGIENIKRNNGRIEFVVENQGNWTCEVNENDDESPVFCNVEALFDPAATGHEIVCESLPHFLVTFCLQELVMGSKHVGRVGGKSVGQVVRGDVQPVWLDGWYVFKEPTHSFYICENRLLLMEMYGDLWYSCNTEKALELFVDRQSTSPIW